jgi:hypothetical protein
MDLREKKLGKIFAEFFPWILGWMVDGRILWKILISNGKVIIKTVPKPLVFWSFEA